jgi:phosphonate transport system ATP-binding protein
MSLQHNRPIISLRRVETIFPNGFCALRNVSLDIHADEVIAVLGPSGAGKSTLLRSINRLNEPTAGQILVDDEDVTHVSGRRLRELRQRVGMVFQSFNLVERRTVLENVLAGRLRFKSNFLSKPLSIFGYFSRRDQEIAFDCLDQVGIAAKALERVGTLSGGQRQRVAIARLLAQEPRVILADEPVASLDPHSSQRVMEILVDIHRRKRIPLIVNLHQLDLAQRIATRVVALKSGEVVFDGPSRSFDRATSDELYASQPTVERSVSSLGEIPLPALQAEGFSFVREDS